MRYVQVAVLVGVIAGAVALKMLWDTNQELRVENSVLTTQIETHERNTKLLSTLLERERETRAAAQTALSELSKEVPDVVYQQELPPSVQGVLDRFHDRIRQPQ